MCVCERERERETDRERERERERVGRWSQLSSTTVFLPFNNKSCIDGASAVQ